MFLVPYCHGTKQLDYSRTFSLVEMAFLDEHNVVKLLIEPPLDVEPKAITPRIKGPNSYTFNLDL